MGPQDGVDLFVQAARLIAEARPGEVRFVAMGGGPMLDALREQVLRQGLSDDVTFTGRVPDDLVRRVLSSADVAISPDPANDFNEYCTMNKTLEYMAVGVPVVAFDLEETRVSAADAAVVRHAERSLGPRGAGHGAAGRPGPARADGRHRTRAGLGAAQLGQQRAEPALRVRSCSRPSQAAVSAEADRYHRPGRVREGATRDVRT